MTCWAAIVLGGLLAAVGSPTIAYSAEVPDAGTCAVLPAGKIGDTVGATVSFGAEDLTACCTIPADQHQPLLLPGTGQPVPVRAGLA